MDTSQLADYILRQSRGELSPEEAKAFRDWYEASDAHRELYRQYAVILRAQAFERGRATFETTRPAAWARTSRQWKRRTHPARRRRLPATLARYAAAACIAFAAGWWCSVNIGRPQTAETQTQAIETPLGAKSHICLPDGSTVWLNSGSRLTYNSTFGDTDRRLSLDGEGYFEVARDEEHPFLICTERGSIVRVLGTKFNLKAYSEDRESKVTLVEGSLAVYADAQKPEHTVIRPNEQIVIDQQTHVWRTQQVEASNYTAWTKLKKEDVNPDEARQAASDPALPQLEIPTSTMRNALLFDEEPLSQIIRDLGRAFNIRIKIDEKDSSLGEEKYYGDFRNGEDIYEIMNVITSGGHLGYRIESNTIIIYRVH